MYVRHENGKITAVSPAGLSPGLCEDELPDDDPQLAAFLNPVVIVSAVSARQFKLQLWKDGLLDEVDAWVATQSKAVQIAYEYSATFIRSDDMMTLGFTSLGFSEARIYQFFADASQL